MVSLRSYQEELKRLIFFHDQEHAESFLWDSGIPPRLEVYRNNTRGNWTDTIDHDFPLTKQQFSENEWQELRRHYFVKYPPAHWELNTSMTPFIDFLSRQKVKPYVKELADYEWHDLKIFIDRSTVRKGMGMTNPTAVVRVYHHQIFYWVEAGSPKETIPEHKPEVLVFYRDSHNTSHIIEADPLMLLMMDHFRRPSAKLEDLEPLRQRLLPKNNVPLETVLHSLKETELLLL
jgi:hypothetical protein